MDDIGLLRMGSAFWKDFVLTTTSRFPFGFLRAKVCCVLLLVHRYKLKMISRYNFVWVRRVSLAFVRLRRTLMRRAQ